VSRSPRTRPAEEIIEDADASLLDVIDNLLNQGVVLSGEVILSLASIDLVYLRLSALLCAADRIFPQARRPRKTRPRLRRLAKLRRP
jgi:hypothetical protein